MNDSYKIAKYLIISSTLIFFTTVVVSVLFIDTKEDDKSLAVLLNAPGEVLKITATGIIGFISGIMTEKNSRANINYETEEDDFDEN